MNVLNELWFTSVSGNSAYTRSNLTCRQDEILQNHSVLKRHYESKVCFLFIWWQTSKNHSEIKVCKESGQFLTYIVCITWQWNYSWLDRTNMHSREPAQRPWAPSIGLNFAALHRQWWRLHISEKFLSGT
jgi:hypothetical protein